MREVSGPSEEPTIHVRGREQWAVLRLKPGEGQPMHSHTFEHSIVVVSGRVIIGTEEAEAGYEGFVELWAPADIPHFFVAETDAIVITLTDLVNLNRRYFVQPKTAG